MKGILALTSILALSGCTLNRMGESATSQSAEELVVHSEMIAAAERLNEEQARRISQLEEVLTYQGERSELELEDMDGVRREIQTMRGSLERLNHIERQGTESTAAFREDVAFRLAALEAQVAAIQTAFGLEPVAATPAEGEAGEASEEASSEAASEEESGEGAGDSSEASEEGSSEEVTTEESSEETASEAAASEEPAEESAEESAEASGESSEERTPLVVAEEAIAEGHPRVARAVLERHLREDESAAQNPEVLYRLAETWFAEGLYEQAGLRFQSVVELGGGSSWAAWAMVRQGECFAQLGDNAGASFFWEDVVREYEGSEAAEMAATLLGR